MEAPGIYLCVMSDDFGMHPAINEGIVKALLEGVLTCTDIMAPCPAFSEAASLARTHQISLGLHITLTCEWDRYHWGPLTHAPSLTTPEGWLKNRFEKVWRTAQESEVVQEIEAQAQAVLAEGLEVASAACHMAGQKLFFRAYGEISPTYRRPIRRTEPSIPPGLPVLQWDSVFYSTTHYLNYQRRKSATLRWLRSLQPGYHFWITHVALDHPSVDEMCSPDSPIYRWARPYRALDFALVMDEEIKDLIAERDIELIPIPTSRAASSL